MTSTGV